VRDVYRRSSAQTILMSDDNGTDPDAEVPASFKAQTADGLVLIFETAESLVEGDNDAFVDVYRRSSAQTIWLSAPQPPA
jgi:hypothetical protein